MAVQRRALTVISMLAAVIGIAACGTSDSPTPTVSPTADSPTPTATATLEPSPSPTIDDLFLSVVDFYPVTGASGVPTETTIQFVLYRPLPVVRLSLSPEVPVEIVQFRQNDRRDESAGVGELYMFRPEAPLAHDTSYEAILEIGYVDETGHEDTVTRVYQFTTSDGSDEDFASEVTLPLLPVNNGPSLGAEASGEIVIEGNCLYLDDYRPIYDETHRVIPLFEDGTVWWEGNLFFHRGNRYEVGDTLSIGGGETKTENLSRIEFVQEPNSSCDLSQPWSNG